MKQPIKLPTRGWMLTLEMTEHEAQDLIAGYVPNALKAQVLGMLRYAEEDERRAARPVKAKV